MSFLKALQKKNHSSPPIWFMRQAGRVLPPYQKLREKTALYDLFHNPKLIAEITQMPIDLLDVDAAILFSDILTLLDGFHIPYHFEEKKGPVIQKYIEKLSDLPPHNFDYPLIHEAIKICKKELKKPLIGFAGAPLTVASYLIEPKHSYLLSETKKWFYQRREEFLKLLDKITDATITYIQHQINAGIDALQIFDSWASVFPPSAFRLCSLEPLKKIAQAVNHQVPLIFFSRHSGAYAEIICEADIDALSIDTSSDISLIRKKLPSIALQGNLDPSILLSDEKTIQKETALILSSMKNDPGFIFNLGHGILPCTDYKKVQSLIAYVRSFN